MGRVKVLGFFALLGFSAGVAAYFAYSEYFSAIIQSVPEVLQVEWFLSGLAGSVLTILTIVLWAYLSPSSATATG